MSEKKKSRDLSRLGPIDYVLMCVATCLAVYSGGMAVGKEALSFFFVFAVVGGTIVSLVVRTVLANSPIVKVDGILYAGAVISAVFLASKLNGFLPDEGFPRELQAAGLLCWMLLLGSALTWRDGTLLFQAIPSVALFGLIGCYDTYKAAPILFFGFLLCLATLLGRAHSREMLRQAVLSGYFNRADAPNTPTEFPEQSPELYEDIKRGPWKWLAGPQWAMLSGLAVVVVSAIGAPVVRATVEPISSIIKVTAPTMKKTVQQAPASPDNVQTVGNGPITSLSENPVYEARLDKLRYLRFAVYDTYINRAWQNSNLGKAGVDGGGSLGIDSIKGRTEFEFMVKPLGSPRVVPVPVGTNRVSTAGMLLQPDAGAVVSGKTPTDGVNGTGFDYSATPRKALHELGAFSGTIDDTLSVPSGVQDFTQQAIQGARTDWDKAVAIKHAIEKQCKYNIKAAPTPIDKDPVENFLFDQQEGYCDLFASSMVLCARSAGIPARYVVGYLGDSRYTDSKGNYVIRDADYHAWAELLFEDVGWVVFDATEGAQQVEGGQRGKSLSDLTPWYKKDWVTNALNIVIAGLGIGAAGYWVYTNRAVGRSATKRSQVEKLYDSFASTLGRATGRRRAIGETPDEYLEAIAPMLNGAAAGAQQLNKRFVRALYSKDSPDEAAVSSLRSALKEFQKTARAGIKSK